LISGQKADITRSFMLLRSYRSKVGVAVGIGLAVVALACVATVLLLPPPADCVEHSRNPYRFRDWQNFVDGLRGTDGAAVVALISDSQGYAGEYPGRRSYAARLEELLNERRTGGRDRWEVLNLSIDGVTPMEYMALAAYLQDHSPTWLISVSGSADYRADNYTRGFSYPRTDLPQLLTEGRLARRLPAAFWRRHGRVEDTLTAWMTRRMPLLRFRDFLWSWLDTRHPGAQKAFYAPRTTYRFWQLPGKARTQPVPDPFPDKTKGRLDLTYDELSTVMLGEFIGELAKIPAAHRLVAAAPLKEDYAGTPDGPWIARFREDLGRFCAAQGLPFRDLTDALPSEDFITSNHLHDRNHRRMAELLADHIAAEMER
jgi:hypothetical protein